MSGEEIKRAGEAQMVKGKEIKERKFAEDKMSAVGEEEGGLGD